MKIISDYNHYNIKASNILADFYENGKSVDWQGKKISTMELACSYERLGNKKHYRVKDCGSFLEFKRFEDQSLKLNKANFCKVRLCPLCSWRRSLKIFGQVSKVMNYLESEEYAFLFLTLTTRNCLGFDLSTTIDLIFKAFKKLTRSKEFKKSVEGFLGP